MSDSDSSSEDDNLKRLQEAADTQFFNNSLYQKKSCQPNNKAKDEVKLPSLRNNTDEEEHYNFIRVTQGFRDYVAKHLDKRLEQSVKYSETKDCNKSKITETVERGGVRLFRDSKVYLQSTDQDFEEDSVRHNKRKRHKIKKHKYEHNDEEDEDSKVKSVVVSPEDVLNQTGTEHWTYKNKVFKYKKSNNGSLVSID